MFHGFRHVVPPSSSSSSSYSPAVAVVGGLGHGVSRTTHSALLTTHRFSFKYATKPQHNEMRQPAYIHDKRFGVFSYERHIGKPRRGLPHVTPVYTKHMNLWETDTDAQSNRYFRSYVFGQRELHQLLGRPHGFEARGQAGQDGLSDFETHHDMRHRGLPSPALTHMHYEANSSLSSASPISPWPYHTLYRRGQHGSEMVQTDSPYVAALLGPELIAQRDAKSATDCQAWFARLQHLIREHYDAVGDVGPYQSRHTQHVHRFFVAFHEALSQQGEQGGVQDSYLLAELSRSRPAELSDLFAIFIEMEANYIHLDYCPRCSLPYATTRYCGEGDVHTDLRRHRGRWAAHPRWGAEWFRVVVYRAEALWRRACEDPFFGTARHTQRQVEAMLRVYVKAKERAKALDFVHRTRGSQEFLLGEVTITPEMTAAVDELLDCTPHPHMLTNGFVVQGRAAVYLNNNGNNSSSNSKSSSSLSVPHSPLQMRLDLEMDKARRAQRECGVVRVPPALWRIDTSAIVPYTVDGRTGRVNNWRAVKAGIERSFLSTGLPPEAYTSAEQRAMAYWRVYVSQRAVHRAALAEQLRCDEARVAAHNRRLRREDETAGEGESSRTTDEVLLAASCEVAVTRDNMANSSGSSGNTHLDDRSRTTKSGRSETPSTHVDGLEPSELLPDTHCVSIVFPDRHWYRVFDATPTRLAREFGVGVSGTVYTVTTRTFADAAAVPYVNRGTNIAGEQSMTLNTTAEACRVFGGYESGDVLMVSLPASKLNDSCASHAGTADVAQGAGVPPPSVSLNADTTSSTNNNSSSSSSNTHKVELTSRQSVGAAQGAMERVKVVVVGVNTHGPESEWELYAMYADAARHARDGLLALGRDVHDIQQRLGGTGQESQQPSLCYALAQSVPLVCLDDQRRVREESVGQVVGVRGGVLYVQWWYPRGGDSVLDRGVAVPLGTAAEVRRRYRFTPYTAEQTSSSHPSSSSSSSRNSSSDGNGARVNRHVHQENNSPTGHNRPHTISAREKNSSCTVGVGEGEKHDYASPSCTVQPLHEPASWRVPFRNDRAEEQLKALEQAPFTREAYGSLIRNKYTPTKKRFGYTQHTTQDDFATTEYQDRLLSRQFFHNPQAFTVIPERRESAVHYAEDGTQAPAPTRGSNPNSLLPQSAQQSAPSRVCGLPTVDRHEMEQGWSSSEPVSEVEVAVIEQALRDISGQRPGNRIKSADEVAALRLNEPWWLMLQHGWSAHNEEQRAVVREGSERAVVDRATLPYSGTTPPFGTSYGIGERIREVVADYAKGFGLAPTHDTVQGMENAATLCSAGGGGGGANHTRAAGLVGALVRLFDAKLQESHGGDVHAWALDAVEMEKGAGGGGSSAGAVGDVRHVLLALHEWREVGRRPALMLQPLLARYLHAEVAAFNAGVPAGVPRLTWLSGSRAAEEGGTYTTTTNHNNNNSSSSSSSEYYSLNECEDSVWCDVHRRDYRIDYAQRRWGRDSEEGGEGVGYIVTLVQRAEAAIAAASSSSSSYLCTDGNDNGSLGASHTPNALYAAASSQERFEQSLWRLVNQGIPHSWLAQKCSQLHRGSVRHSGVVAAYVRASFLATLLHRRGVSSGDVALVMRGLANTPEQEPLPDGSDFMVPVSLVLGWAGPRSGGRVAGRRQRAAAAAAASSSSVTSSSSSSMNDAVKGRQDERSTAAGGGGSGRRGMQALHQALYGGNANSEHRGEEVDTDGGMGGHSASALEDKMVIQVLDELALCDDGFVMDVRYTVRENRRNAVLRNEFCAAFLPVFGNDVARVCKLYEDYCEGKYVPNVSVAVEAFVAFLAQISAPDYVCETTAASSRHRVLSHTANVAADNHSFHVPPSHCRETTEVVDVRYVLHPVVPYLDHGADGRSTQMRLLPPECGSFQFENTLAEQAETVARFERYGIAAGPTRVTSSGFIAAHSKSLTYFTRRREEVVYVTVENDQGLGRVLRQSPHYEGRIARHAGLRELLRLPTDSASHANAKNTHAHANAALVACFNRFYHRVTPMLSFYQGVLARYAHQVRGLHAQSQLSHRRLARVLDAEASTTLEQSFRRHAERYWRMLLEGRSAEETSLIASTTTAITVKRAMGSQDNTRASAHANDRSTSHSSSTAAAAESVTKSSGTASACGRSAVTTPPPSTATRRRDGDVVDTAPPIAARSSGSRSMNDLLTRLRAPAAGSEKKRTNTTPSAASRGGRGGATPSRRPAGVVSGSRGGGGGRSSSSSSNNYGRHTTPTK